MKKRLFIAPFYIVLLVLIAVGGYLTVVLLAQEKAEDYRDLQLEAAVLMEEAEKYMKEEILARGLEIEVEDLNQTGLLGPEFTELTSTPGEVGAKRSALNPEFAAQMVRYYHEAGLEKGDKIAISTSGSFPGFVLATICAASTMELDIFVSASVGASMHGATRVEYNVFDMLHALKEGGFASFNLVSVSCGGRYDLGGSVLEGILYEDTPLLSLNLCEEASLWSGAEIIHEEKLSSSISRRLELFGDDVKLFVNIGGASVNNGTTAYTLDFPQGLVMSFPRIPEGDEIGLNYEYAKRGVPVLNLLNVKKLCQDNGLKFDPVPLPTPSSYTVYSTVVYSSSLSLFFVVLFFATLLIGIIRSKTKK